MPLPEDLQALVERSGVRQGLLVAVGQHTTTALVLNENEERLLPTSRPSSSLWRRRNDPGSTTTCTCARAFRPMSPGMPTPT